ncbi:MAG: EF-P beta-lysylation protein EpmB [Planctomycetota bacterium]
MKQDFVGSLAIPRPFVPTSPKWQHSLRTAIRSEAELREFVGLPPHADGAGSGDFPVMVTREFAARMQHGDARDPLLRQVLPDAREQDDVTGFDSDPVGEDAARIAPGLLHKYHGRALVIATGACGIHCRYCFRREYPYIETSDRSQKYDRSIAAIAADDSIDEVILSGGDPLTLTDDALSMLVSKIETIAHVRRLRLHTRMPIVLPSRVTDSLVDRLRRSRLAVWWVVHTNHPKELDESTLSSLGRLVDGGFPVLNQSVLLHSINDDADTLAALNRRLMDARVMPYYLHQLDRVRGAAHFEVPESRGHELIAQLRERLPGYGVPRYVREIAGEPSKTLLVDRSMPAETSP